MLDDLIRLEKKPTASQAVCSECRKSIEKGFEMVSVVSGSWKGRALTWQRFHHLCFWRALLKIVKKPKGRYMKGFEMAMQMLNKS